MKFTKMHGTGNDYVYVNCLKETIKQPEAVARFVSDRHFGIGSDGLILIKPSKTADFEMAMYNVDGSRGEMCGNGIRCVAKYVYDYGLTEKTSLDIETLAGVKHLDLTIISGRVAVVSVNMGGPMLEAAKIPVLSDAERVINEPIQVNGIDYRITGVSMGNPHCVVFMQTNVEEMNLNEVGPYFENHSCFPKKINTEFVNVIDENTLRMRVWERGSGETMACGTGACAVVVAAVLNKHTETEVNVQLAGGNLLIRWNQEENQVYMTGPATVVFDGEITLPKGLN